MARGDVTLAHAEPDLATPQREAAMFYGLFLRGHPVDRLRREIDIPRRVVEKWMRARRHEPEFKEAVRRAYRYRKTVLAIFDELVLNERGQMRIQ